MTLIPTLLHDPVALIDNLKCPFISPQLCSTKKKRIWLSGKIYIAAVYVDREWQKKGKKNEIKRGKNTKYAFVFAVFSQKKAVFFKKGKK